MPDINKNIRYADAAGRGVPASRALQWLLLALLMLAPLSVFAQDPRLFESVICALIDTSKLHLGKPYKFRNDEGNIMDCSGFLQYVYKLNSIALPRTSREMANFCRKLDYRDALPGDLLFFKAWNKSSREVAHVSMVIENNGGILKMIHSGARGVVIDEFPTREHYKNRYLFAGRIPTLETLLSKTPAAAEPNAETASAAIEISEPASPVN